MKKINVNLDDLIDAFDFSDSDNQHFLDTHTGKIIFLQDPDFADETIEEEEFRQQIEEDTEEKYIIIPEQDSNEGYSDMQSFIETLKDKNLQEKFWIALNGKGCFRQFKDVLLNFTKEQEQWFNFKKNCTKKNILEWLRENGLEISN